MSAAPSPEAGLAPADRLRRLEQACDRFEGQWKAGQHPRLEDYLTALPESERPTLLRELLLLEIDYRRLAGEQPQVDSFLARFPALDRAWVASVLAKATPTVVQVKSDPPADKPDAVTATPAGVPQRLELPAVSGASPELARDLQVLLRKRLRFISLVVLGLYVYCFVQLGIFLFPNLDRIAEHAIYLPPFVLALLTAAFLTIVLWKKWPLSLGQLRGIELTLFGVVLVQLAYELFGDLFFSPPFTGAAPWANTSASDMYFLHLYGHYASLPYVLLIVSYATLIPSNWRRCTLVVGMMALTPITISVAASIWVAVSPLAFFHYYILAMVLDLAIAVAIAAYGTHRIELLRQQAIQARQLGQYLLKQHLGTGGMGEVYLAEHRLLKQPCAIKLIRPERAGDPTTLRRFEREVQATARLKHWNTVQIFDYGHAADGTFYYVMEYLPGVTLEQLVKQRGPLAFERAVHLLKQTCMALCEAHGLGLIHRDIKPANIMVCQRGGVADVVKLLDFGLVKATERSAQDTTLTQEGAIAGTPAYMSPEQASGMDQLDGRSDIYSLGAVAYFLLTGQPPFPRDRAMAALVAHLHEPVRPLTELRADVPAQLQAVVLRCLEKDPNQRFADVSSLHQAFEKAST